MCCTQYPENLENSAVATWPERSIFILIPKMSNAKECSNYCIIALISYASWRRQWHPTPVLLPGKSHGQRSLVGCSPWSHYELDTTKRLYFHFSLSCTREGNGDPLQYSCLENPRDAEPGGLPSLGSHRVGDDWSNLAAAAAYASKVMLKILQARLQQYVNHELPDVQAGFSKGRGPEIKLPTSIWS